MANMVAGSDILITFYGELVNQKIINTFHYRVTGVPAPLTSQLTAVEALHTALLASNKLKAKFLAVMPGNYTMLEMWIQVLLPVRTTKFTFVEGTNGLSGEPAATANLAASITRRTEFSGRRQVGKLQLTSPTTTQWVDDGVLSTDAKTAYGGLAVEMLALYNAGGYTYTPVIGPGVDGQGNFRQIVSATVQPNVRTMHRRTVGLGI